MVGTVWAGNGGGDAEVLVGMGVEVRVLEIEDEDILEMTRFVMRINGLLRKLGVLRCIWFAFRSSHNIIVTFNQYLLHLLLKPKGKSNLLANHYFNFL